MLISDGARLMIQVMLLPVVWMTLQKIAIGPTSRFVLRHFSYRIARILTRKILERK